MKHFAKIFITLTEVPLFLVRSKSNDNRTISLVPLDLDKYAVKIEKNKKKMNHINYYWWVLIQKDDLVVVRSRLKKIKRPCTSRFERAEYRILYESKKLLKSWKITVYIQEYWCKFFDSYGMYIELLSHGTILDGLAIRLALPVAVV